ncbi:MAG: conjugal transfer pilus assembly protein TraB [Colwellia sp.]|jgi:conjugal transfer pilus assembly protein TraB
MISGLKDKWEVLTPKAKHITLLGGVGGIIIIAVIAGSDEKTVKVAPAEKNIIELIERNTGSMDMEQLVGQIQLLSTKVLSIQDKMASTDENVKSVKRSLSLNTDLVETPQILYDLKRQMELIKKEQERLSEMNVSDTLRRSNSDTDFINEIIDDEIIKAEPKLIPIEEDIFGDASTLTKEPPTDTTIPDSPLAYVNLAYEKSSLKAGEKNQYVTSTENFSDPEKPNSGSSIKIIQSKKSEHNKQKKEAKDEWLGAVLPAGTLIPGIVISGVDAPTGKAAEKGAVISTIRITGPAILPNGERVDLTGCFVVNDVRGDLATQRASFRPQVLTCSLAGIGIVDTPIQGYVSGKDGTLGFRGKVVNKQGSALMYAGAAGVIGGFGNAFSGGSGTNTITTGGQFDLPSTDDAMTAGIGEGISAASDTLSEYYKEQLDLLYPIIEIKPMIFGSIHLIKTVQLRLFKAKT